jgi:Protein of unknown function (DUF3074)
MAALHEALQTLSPIEWDEIEHSDLKSFLQESMSKSQTLIDSVPPPPEDMPTLTRPRSNTNASSSSNGSEVSTTADHVPASSLHAALQKEWGKPIKLAPKDNPLGIHVYKLGGKDGKGAWFARRSCHEGLGFKKWKKSLEREFHESLQVHGGPGEGNVRGIGADRRIVKKKVEGAGEMAGAFLLHFFEHMNLVSSQIRAQY